MYPAITLYPNGGAFMICEDASEFDPNVQPPAANVAIQQAPPIDYNHMGDPVMHLLTKLRPVYERVVQPMLTTGYEFDDANVGISLYEQAANGMTTITNALRCALVKTRAMYMVFEDERMSPEMDQFSTHIGIFMKNVDKIRMQGIEHFNYSYNYIPAFERRWDVRTITAVVTNQPQLLDQILLMSTLKIFMDMGSDSNLVKSFESTVDVIRCLFDDPQRMARLEATRNQQGEFNDLMYRAAHRAGYNDCVREDGEADLLQKFLTMMSKTLRCTAQCCYDAQCELSNAGTDMTSDHRECVSKLFSRCVNLFSIGTMIGMYYATALRKFTARKEAVDSYTNLLVNTLKTV